jgi:hypothetical protein
LVLPFFALAFLAPLLAGDFLAAVFFPADLAPRAPLAFFTGLPGRAAVLAGPFFDPFFPAAGFAVREFAADFPAPWLVAGFVAFAFGAP